MSVVTSLCCLLNEKEEMEKVCVCVAIALIDFSC